MELLPTFFKTMLETLKGLGACLDNAVSFRFPIQMIVSLRLFCMGRRNGTAVSKQAPTSFRLFEPRVWRSLVT